MIHQLQSGKNKYYKVIRKRKIDFKVIKKIRSIIKINGIRIIHTHQMIELLYAVILKQLDQELKLFHTIHGYHDSKNKWAQLLEQFLIKYTQNAFTVSNSTQNILRQKGYPKKKLHVIYNAVNLPKIVNCEKDFKKLIHYKNSDYIVGMIGNFVWWKDQITIVKAFNLIKDTLPQLKVVLIGKESELAEECLKLAHMDDINNRIFFLGAKENASQYLPIFNILIMSTIMDTFGIVVIEALMQKVPVIASNIDVMKELSHNGKFFDLFEAQNPQCLANTILKLYYHEDRKKIEEAFYYANKTFNFQEYIFQLERQYLTS